MDSGTGSNAWLQTKIAECVANNPDKTVAIVAHQTEIKDGALEGILPAGLAQCKDFRQDLNLHSSYWFYYNSKRTLLVQKSKDKDDAAEHEIRKSFRTLATVACAALQAQKLLDVEFLVTSKVCGLNQMGIFQNSFYLTNYENSLKFQPPIEGEGKDEDEDLRSKRVKKNLNNYTITCETADAMETDDVKFLKACALGTELARSWGNVRGGTADPQWMEDQIRNNFTGKPGVKEIRVLNCQ